MGANTSRVPKQPKPAATASSEKLTVPTPKSTKKKNSSKFKIQIVFGKETQTLKLSETNHYRLLEFKDREDFLGYLKTRSTDSRIRHNKDWLDGQPEEMREKLKLELMRGIALLDGGDGKVVRVVAAGGEADGEKPPGYSEN